MVSYLQVQDSGRNKPRSLRRCSGCYAIVQKDAISQTRWGLGPQLWPFPAEPSKRRFPSKVMLKSVFVQCTHLLLLVFGFQGGISWRFGPRCLSITHHVIKLLICNLNHQQTPDIGRQPYTCTYGGQVGNLNVKPGDPQRGNFCQRDITRRPEGCQFWRSAVNSWTLSPRNWNLVRLCQMHAVETAD
jgi:hypothetical protein